MAGLGPNQRPFDSQSDLLPIALGGLAAGPGSWVGCTWHADNRRFNHLVLQHLFMEIGQEIISMAILSLPLIQVGQLSDTGERMST